MATVERTPEMFKWHLEKIACARDREMSSLLHDCWLDGQVWNNRKRFEGGLCDFLGNWPAKSIELASFYACARQIPSLEALTGVPLMYVVLVDLQSQTALLREILLPYLFHYRKSKSPPSILVVGKYFGSGRAQDSKVLKVSEDASEASGISIEFSPVVSALFKASSPRVSLSASEITPSAPFSMFSAELTMAPL
jgi:hypothetical protein